jgi:hypothetical protein
MLAAVNSGIYPRYYLTAIYLGLRQHCKIVAMDRGTISPAPGAGIEREIAELYEREAGAILRYAWGLARDQETAHDALQEAFFRFFLCRSAGQQIRSAKSWLFRVAHN